MVLEIRIEPCDVPTSGRCICCWQRMDIPELVHAQAYADGEPYGLVCVDCLCLDEAAFRAQLNDTADTHQALADEGRAFAQGSIVRPPAAVLALERIARLPSPVVIDRIG